MVLRFEAAAARGGPLVSETEEDTPGQAFAKG